MLKIINCASAVGTGCSSQHARAALSQSILRYDIYNVRPLCYDKSMITHADDEQYFHRIQAMIDLDFEDIISVERLTSVPENDPWYLR